MALRSKNTSRVNLSSLSYVSTKRRKPPTFSALLLPYLFRIVTASCPVTRSQGHGHAVKSLLPALRLLSLSFVTLVLPLDDIHIATTDTFTSSPYLLPLIHYSKSPAAYKLERTAVTPTYHTIPQCFLALFLGSPVAGQPRHRSAQHSRQSAPVSGPQPRQTTQR